MDRAMAEKRIVEVWDRMLDICPRCEHCLDQYEVYGEMSQAVEELRDLHFPLDAYRDEKARHDAEEDVRYETVGTSFYKED